MDHSTRHFWGLWALLFLGCAALTVNWCSTMTAMGGMSMPGGWTMSMTWMRMPGQSWPGAVASFVGMWLVMMLAMMSPSLVPALWRYRQSLDGDLAHRGWLTALAAIGYFSVWALWGLVAFPLGVVLAQAEMHDTALARAVPLAVGAVVLAAGALQFTSWKSRQLACCRDLSCRRGLPVVQVSAAREALVHGLRLGVRCSYCCAGLTAVLLVVDLMDLRAMVLLSVATTLERLLPWGTRVARAVGVLVLGAGVMLLLGAISYVP